MGWGCCLQQGVIGWLGRQRDYHWRGRFLRSGSVAYGFAIRLDTLTEISIFFKHS